MTFDFNGGTPIWVTDKILDPKKSRVEPTGKDAKLAAALRDNLLRRKAAARKANVPQGPRPTEPDSN